MEEAELRGDGREVREFREYLERVESMIEQSGGDPDGSTADPSLALRAPFYSKSDGWARHGAL